MIILAEGQLTTCSLNVIRFLEEFTLTEDLTKGEWITILATSIFMLGQQSNDKGKD